LRFAQVERVSVMECLTYRPGGGEQSESRNQTAASHEVAAVSSGRRCDGLGGTLEEQFYAPGAGDSPARRGEAFLVPPLLAPFQVGAANESGRCLARAGPSRPMATSLHPVLPADARNLNHDAPATSAHLRPSSPGGSGWLSLL
jgi:hypothetical protein